MRILFAVLGLVVVGALLASWQVSQPLFDEALETDPIEVIELAPAASALTFARLQTPLQPRVLLVAGADAEGLDAIDLEVVFGRRFIDPVHVLAELDETTLATALADSQTFRVAWEDLAIPFEPTFPQIAAGTNFRAHAEEVGLDDGPFLFPKLTHPTRWNSAIPPRARLDYEAELCALTLNEHTSTQAARLGYVLCNDYTDRWTLLRDIDLDAPMGTTGFPDAKGGPGMLPVGPLLVVPRDAHSFYRTIALELYVNDQLRQRSSAGMMIWSPVEILAQALAGCDVDYLSKDGDVKLTTCSGIPANTLILTGTPAGVMFHPVNIWNSNSYLKEGDEVVTVATYLGVLRNAMR